MEQELVKFSTQAKKELLNEVKELAKIEGKHFQNLIEEALIDLLDKHNNKIREPVLQSSRKNRIKYNSVFQKLAK